MASSRKPKVVSTVKRDKPASTKAAVTKTLIAANKGIVKPRTLAKAKAKASRDAVMKGIPKKAKLVSVKAPEIVRETPVILESQNGKPLAERLNAALRKQLAERKVTNAAAAEALGVSETYLSRTVAAMGIEKAPGKTTAHRNARHELAALRNKHRETLAKKVNKGEMTIEAASKNAKCSLRTMFRWCEKYANQKKRA